MLEKRVEREIELFPTQWEMFDQIGQALGHEDVEETMRLLIELGWKAVGVTDAAHRKIKVIGGFRRDVGKPCSACGNQRVVYERETTVVLGMEDTKEQLVKEED